MGTPGGECSEASLRTGAPHHADVRCQGRGHGGSANSEPYRRGGVAQVRAVQVAEQESVVDYVHRHCTQLPSALERHPAQVQVGAQPDTSETVLLPWKDHFEDAVGGLKSLLTEIDQVKAIWAE